MKKNMKVEVSKNKKERDFPKLMTYNNIVVLMLNKMGSGMRVDPNLISYALDWPIDKFIDFEGLITLSND